MGIPLSQYALVIAALAAISFAGEEEGHTHLTSDGAGSSGHWFDPWEPISSEKAAHYR